MSVNQGLMSKNTLEDIPIGTTQCGYLSPTITLLPRAMLGVGPPAALLPKRHPAEPRLLQGRAEGEPEEARSFVCARSFGAFRVVSRHARN